MNKKLTAKLQKIQPDLPANSRVISGSFSIEPETKDLVIKKGVIYCVYNINAPSDLTVPIATKIFTDILHNSYYSSDNISPIQSLEKAMMEAKEKIGRDYPELDFNTICAVLWGNVVYLVQMGVGETFLMREGDTRKINSIKEGNFSSTSGVVRADDVIILCTQAFSEKYTPQRLLTTPVESKDLELSEAGLIIKFIVDLSFTENESVDFVATPIKKKKENPVLAMVKKIKLPARKPSVVASLTAQPQPEQPAAVRPHVEKRRFTVPKLNISKRLVVILVVLILLVASVSYTLATRSKTPEVPESTGGITIQQEPQPEEPKEPEHPPIDPAVDLAQGVTRIDTEPFYDIKIVDSNANTSEITATNSSVVIADNTNGKAYISALATPKFEPIEGDFAGIKSISTYDNSVNMLLSGEYRILSATGDLENSYELLDATIAKPYLTNIYAISGNTLNRYARSTAELTPTLWGEAAEFTNAKDMEIAVSIYLVTNSNQIVKYTSGEKDTFSLNGIPTPLGDICCIWTDLDSDYIYIADPQNKRIVVVDTEGEFVRQYKHTKENDWSDIKDIYINETVNQGYLLNGSKVYVFELVTIARGN